MSREAGAAARNAGPDRLGVAGAVDRAHRVHALLIKIECAGAERIVETSRHAAGIFARLGLALDHLLGRGPGRPFRLAPDVSLAGPQEALTGDISAIAGGVSVVFDAVNIVIGRIDDDRAGRFTGVVAHGPAIIFRIDLADVDRWYREFLVGHGPVELRRSCGPCRRLSRNRRAQARRD